MLPWSQVLATDETSLVSDCTLSGNWGLNGGAAARVTLEDCDLYGNTAETSGGAGYYVLRAEF